MIDDLRFARQEATAGLVRTYRGVPVEAAWRQASYILWLRWLDQRGSVDLEGVERRRDEQIGTMPLGFLIR